MTKIILNDLVNANNSKMLKSLDIINNDIKHLSNDLISFHDSSITELVGGGYDAVRSKMELYADCLDKLSSIAINLSAAIKAANNTMINFMEGYAELDDSKIPEVENALIEAKNYLAWLEDYHFEDGPDDNGDGVPDSYVKVRNGTDGEISECQALIAALTHLLEKLKQLASMDKSAFSSIDAVRQDIISYVTALSEIRIPNYDGTFPDDDDSLLAKSVKNSKNIGSKNYYSFNQEDERWQGSGYHSIDGNDIASGGCGPCSMAACLATIFQNPDITPYTIGHYMGEHGINNFGGNFVPSVSQAYGLDCDKSFANNDNREESLINLLENGGAAVVGYRGGGHYVAVIGYDSATNKFIVADSYPSIIGYDSTLYEIDYKELCSNTNDEKNYKYGSVWEAIAPPDMTVEEATKPPTKTA